MTIWIGLVQVFLNKRTDAYRGYVYSFDDEPERYEPEIPTNTLAFISPCENDVAVYRGSFANQGEAERAIRDWFPTASIEATS